MTDPSPKPAVSDRGHPRFGLRTRSSARSTQLGQQPTRAATPPALASIGAHAQPERVQKTLPRLDDTHRPKLRRD
jgi:hypothetical protein